MQVGSRILEIRCGTSLALDRDEGRCGGRGKEVGLTPALSDLAWKRDSVPVEKQKEAEGCGTKGVKVHVS